MRKYWDEVKKYWDKLTLASKLYFYSGHLFHLAICFPAKFILVLYNGLSPTCLVAFYSLAQHNCFPKEKRHMESTKLSLPWIVCP